MAPEVQAAFAPAAAEDGIVLGRGSFAARPCASGSRPDRGGYSLLMPSSEHPPSEQRGGTTPDEAEAREKGEWAGTARDGIVSPDLGGSDAPPQKFGQDPELGTGALGRTTATDEPATDGGVDPTAGDAADAVTDGGQNPPVEAEPDLKDAPAASVQREADED